MRSSRPLVPAAALSLALLLSPTAAPAAVAVGSTPAPATASAAAEPEAAPGERVPPLVVWVVVATVRTAGPQVVRVVVRAASSQAAREAAKKFLRDQAMDLKNIQGAYEANYKTAGGFKIKWYAEPKKSDGYSSFAKFKKAYPGKKGYDWHHIVEQNSPAGKKATSKGKAWMVHNKQNLILIPRDIHQKCINAIFASKAKNLSKKERKALGLTKRTYNNVTVRQSLKGFGFQWTHTIGLVVLDLCGVGIGKRPS